jgi:hypothetical protein
MATGSATRIALAAGEYGEAVSVTDTLEIVGRCPSMVTIDGDNGNPNTPAVVAVSSGGALTLRRVRLSGDGAGVYASGSATITVDTALMDGTLGAGVLAYGSGASVELTSTLVQNTRSFGGYFGQGIDAEGGASVTVTDSAFLGNRTNGVYASGTSTFVSLTNVLVEATLAEESTAADGVGVASWQGARIDMLDVAVVANKTLGLLASNPGTELNLANVLVEGTLPRDADQALGGGAQASDGAHLSVGASAFLTNRTVGIVANGADTDVSFDGSLISGTQSEVTSGYFGRGVEVQDGAHVTLTHATLFDNRDVGIIVTGAGAVATADGLLVEATNSIELDGEYGVGMCSADEGFLDASGVAVVGGHVAGLMVGAATAHVQSSIFTAVEPGSFTLLGDGTTYDNVGDGLLATVGSTLDVDGTLAEGCARAGLLFHDSGGTISRTASTDNLYGLVVDGDQDPTVDGMSTFGGNQDASRVDDAKLPVPDAPAELPP